MDALDMVLVALAAVGFFATLVATGLIIWLIVDSYKETHGQEYIPGPTLEDELESLDWSLGQPHYGGLR